MLNSDNSYTISCIRNAQVTFVENPQMKIICSELETLERDILNPDRLINLEINNRRTLFNLKIKKKSGSSINPDIHHSKVPSSENWYLILDQTKFLRFQLWRGFKLTVTLIKFLIKISKTAWLYFIIFRWKIFNTLKIPIWNCA